jgi:hypothetical protein
MSPSKPMAANDGSGILGDGACLYDIIETSVDMKAVVPYAEERY